MKKVVIAGSASLQERINHWKSVWEGLGYEVLDYPKPIPQDEFLSIYPDVHTDFFRKITEADILFVMNEDKKGIRGYIGAETFAELAFGLAQSLVYKREIKVSLLQEPSEQVQSYEEISLWLKLGWVNIYQDIHL